jgi:hypothetical protein
MSAHRVNATPYYNKRTEECKGPTLANQEANPNTGHVKPIQKPLDVVSDLLALIRVSPFNDTPRNSGNGRVVSPLDLVEAFCKPLVEIVHLRRPLHIGRVPIVSPVHGDANTCLVICCECAV